MSRLRPLLMLVLAGSIVALGYIRYAEHRDARLRQDDSRRVQKLMEDAGARANAGATALFFDMAIHAAIPASYPRPASPWITAEKRLYEKILSAGHYDVLVAPLQVDGPAAFDRATRSMMAAELSAAIAAGNAGKVADSFLLEKVLGEGQRQYPENELYRIANLSGARRIVWGAAGHDRKGSMKITVLSQNRPAGATGEMKWSTPIARYKVGAIALDDAHPAFETFAQRIPAILTAISVKLPGAVPTAGSAIDMDTLPGSPLGLTTGADNPARDAYAFLLFGLLTPANMERTKERYAEKALLSAARLSPEAPEYRALRARGYALLGYRPAALATLDGAVNDEEAEIVAMLNGNLPEARLRAARERNPLKRLIAALDVNRIASDYKVLARGEALAAVKGLHLPGDVWPYLVARAFTDRDPWSQFDNAPLKHLIDMELPIQGYSLEELLHGAVAVGGIDKARSLVDLSVFNHARKFIDEHAANCCDPPQGGPGVVDYMELLAAMGNDNLIRRISLMANVQSQGRPAIEYADSLRSVYEGFPYYEVARGEAAVLAAAGAEGAERDGLIKSAYESVFNALYWEQSQSAISSRAMNSLGAYFRIHEYGFFDNFYYTDLPFHPTYMLYGNGGQRETFQANGLLALANATSEFGAVVSLIGADRARYAAPSLVDEVVRQIQGRFIGCPERGTLLADQEASRGNLAAAEALLRENIRAIPGYGKSYYALGELQAESGSPDQAASTFLSDPELRAESGGDRVAISNTAADMAQTFYFAGDFDKAARFLRISAAQQSGSGSEMQSGMRLKLLSGDIAGAQQSALERAQRYNDPRAYRDYFGMLHAQRRSRDAWAGFDALARAAPAPQTWETALVGHHMDGSSEGEVRLWANRPELLGAGNHISYAVAYLVRFATTDRVPSADLAGAIAEMDRPVWQFDTGAHSVVRPDADGRDQQILGPAGAITAEGILPIGVFENGGPRHRVRSALSYFVAAYRAIKLGNYPEARSALAEAATLYDMASPASSFMLPYYALASARAGSGMNDVEAVLDRFSPGERRFDYQLARAVLQARGGKSGDARESLKLARYRRPLDNERVELTAYTYGDICEALYQMTHGDEYRRLAMDWTRGREKIEPWHSWSYALDAALTTDPADRQRALAMAFYLDPHSAHLAAFKKAEIDAAVRAFSATNVFRQEESHARPATAT